MASIAAANLDYVAVASVEEKALPFPDAVFDVVLSFQVSEQCAM